MVYERTATKHIITNVQLFFRIYGERVSKWKIQAKKGTRIFDVSNLVNYDYNKDTVSVDWCLYNQLFQN